MKIKIKKDKKANNNYKVTMELTEGKILAIIFGLQTRARTQQGSLGSCVAEDVLHAFSEAAKAVGIDYFNTFNEAAKAGPNQ
jgi:hypothetical protein